MWDRPPRDNKDSKVNLGEAPINIQWRIEQWFPDLAPNMRQQLKTYHDELIKFSKTVNLISVKTMPAADAIHFADSILASKLIFKSFVINEIYDIGSGNGFPGLVFAILNPQTKVIMVDTDQRKAEFIKHVASTIGLKNISVLIRPVDSLPEKSINFAVSRGFSSIPKAILGTRKLFPKGGKYFHLKSEEWASEVAQIPTQLCSFWTPSLVGEYKLPIGEIKFAVVKTEKISD